MAFHNDENDLRDVRERTTDILAFLLEGRVTVSRILVQVGRDDIFIQGEVSG